MEEEEKLTNVLKIFKENNSTVFDFEIINSKIGSQISKIEAGEIIDKLVEDGFLKQSAYLVSSIKSEMKEDRIYQLTFSGRLFLKNGGYSQQKKDSSRDRKIKKIHLFLLSLAAIATILYTLVEIAKLVLDFQSK